MKTEMIRARVEPSIKTKAEKIFEKLGLNASKAINIFYHQVCITKSIPFDLRIPNKETLKAIKDVDQKKNLVKCKNAEDMFKKLRI